MNAHPKGRKKMGKTAREVMSSDAACVGEGGPVIDGHELTGVFRQRNLAGELGREQVGELLETISA
ncbi:MAG TPA: hypothetical protein VH025_05660 [Solirubrobacteraceae bacterium]|jgi:hypothetical protein|nr:hypothetical protein [Solirubrobacteraceae bacterium]